jgi:hypothetical protein
MGEALLERLPEIYAWFYVQFYAMIGLLSNFMPWLARIYVYAVIGPLFMFMPWLAHYWNNKPLCHAIVCFLCHKFLVPSLINSKAVDYTLVHFVLTDPAWAPFACLKPVTTLLFFIRNMRQARQNLCWPWRVASFPCFHRQVCQNSVWLRRVRQFSYLCLVDSLSIYSASSLSPVILDASGRVAIIWT